MIARFGVAVMLVVALLVSLLIAFGLPRPTTAQEPLPTPEGRLGGRMPLPTTESLPGGSLPQDTPSPSRHPLVGAWLLTFAEPDQAPAQTLFGVDGMATFIDADGNQGVGVWIPIAPQSGVVAIVVRAVDASGRSPQITMLHGPIDVEPSGNTATLAYTVETVDGTGASSERRGPFTATGQRVDEQLIVPTPE